MAGTGSSRRVGLPAALLAYSVALAAFLLIPPLLTAPVGPPRGFTLQEATDLVAPLVIVPLLWLVFDAAGGLGRIGNVLFLVGAAAWVEAHGIHLAANAVGDAFSTDAAREAFYATIPGDLDFWLDEVLSHWLWHITWVGLALLVIVAATRSRAQGDPASPTSGVAGVLHGATFFIVTVEGATTLLGVPAALLALGWGALASRTGSARRPVATFFLVSGIVAVAGYVVWAALNGGELPEFSKTKLPI